jgi:hypothetical protein
MVSQLLKKMKLTALWKSLWEGELGEAMVAKEIASEAGQWE